MAASAYDAYLESRVLSADPLELVRILYRVAIDRIREAREHLEKGDVAARSKAISVASQALIELSTSLDHQGGGEVSRRLAQLYDYMQWRLVDANFHQTAGPLDEVLGLLTTLSEAWHNIRLEPPPVARPAAEPRYLEEQSAGVEYASQGWSA
ncbi:MAG TPA: flagellar export chaperone FliS [Bryobacteraceae bacterium]|nr:flagellar export chaperone FliS [Bryobacteraceae bacterium]